MALAQPTLTSKMNSPDHSALHRIIAADVAAPVQSLNVIASGNVGIGTTNPGYTLDVTGVVRGSAEIISSSLGTAGQFRAIAGNYGIFLRNDGTNSQFMLTASGDQYGSWNALRPLAINNSTGDVSIGNSVLTVKHGGNVGIGTTAPDTNLTIMNPLTNNSSWLSFKNPSGTTKTALGIAGATDNIINGSVAGDFALRTVSQKIMFSTDSGSTAHMVINAGNVGIGITNPGYLLDVNKGQTGGTILQVRNTTQGAGNYGQVQVLSMDATGIIRQTDSTWTPANQYATQSLTIDANGSGGLGLSASGASAGIKLYTGTASATPKVTIDSIGNVGIGTTAPTAKLHLPAAQAGAGLASLKIPSGVVATTPVAGNIEADNDHIYWTNAAGTRIQLDNA